MPVLCVHNYPLATWQPCRMIWAEFTARCVITLCCLNMLVVWVMTGLVFVVWVLISKALTVNHKVLCHSWKSLTTQLLLLTRVVNVKVQFVRTLKPGISTLKNSWICVKTLVMIVVVPTIWTLPTGFLTCSWNVWRKKVNGLCSHQKKCRICMIWPVWVLKKPTLNTKKKRHAVKSVTSKPCLPPTCGAKCSACCLKPVTLGLRLKILVTCVARNNISVSFTAQTCVPKSPWTRLIKKSRSVTSVRSIWFNTLMLTANWIKKNSTALWKQRCVCWITLLSTTITVCRKRVIPTCCIALSVWASWASRMRCINYVFLTAPKKQWNSLMNQWKRLATTRLMRLLIWLQNVANTNLTKAACGAEAFCQLIPSRSLKKHVANICNRMKAKPWIGMHCVTKSNVKACVTPTPWRLHRLQRFQTSVVSASQLNRRIRTCSWNRTCPVSSQSSTHIWLKIWKHAACGMTSWSMTSNTTMAACWQLTVYLMNWKRCTPPHLKWMHAGWLKPRHAVKNGWIRHKVWTCTWRNHPVRKWTIYTNWRGYVASKPLITYVQWAQPVPRKPAPRQPQQQLLNRLHHLC